MTNEEQIENLRGHVMDLIAQVSVIGTMQRTTFAMMCSFDGSPEMRDKLVNGLFPGMLADAKARTYPGAPLELSQWLSNREVELLQQEFAEILQAIDGIRARAHRSLN